MAKWSKASDQSSGGLWVENRAEILLCSKYLQSNFEVPGPCGSLSLGLIPTVLVRQKIELVFFIQGYKYHNPTDNYWMK